MCAMSVARGGAGTRSHVDYRPLALVQAGTQSHSQIQAQNFKSARVYVFGKDDVSEEMLNDEDVDEFEMRPRGRMRQQHKEAAAATERAQERFLEVKVEQNDTLQSIALKYCCRVAELKRVNNLISDQEFFALPILKVPVKRHGLLTEIIDEENKSRPKRGTKLKASFGAHGDGIVYESQPPEPEESSSDYNENWNSSDNENKELLVRTLSIRGTLKNQSKEAQSFLKKMDHDINNIVKSTKSRKDTLEEVTSSLTSKRIQPLRLNSLSGADCGMRWFNVLAILVVILVGLAIMLAVFYYWHRHSEDERATG